MFKIKFSIPSELCAIDREEHNQKVDSIIHLMKSVEDILRTMPGNNVVIVQKVETFCASQLMGDASNG